MVLIRLLALIGTCSIIGLITFIFFSRGAAVFVSLLMVIVMHFMVRLPSGMPFADLLVLQRIAIISLIVGALVCIFGIAVLDSKCLGSVFVLFFLNSTSGLFILNREVSLEIGRCNQ